MDSFLRENLHNRPFPSLTPIHGPVTRDGHTCSMLPHRHVWPGQLDLIFMFRALSGVEQGAAEALPHAHLGTTERRRHRRRGRPVGGRQRRSRRCHGGGGGRAGRGAGRGR